MPLWLVFLEEPPVLAMTRLLKQYFQPIACKTARFGLLWLDYVGKMRKSHANNQMDLLFALETTEQDECLCLHIEPCSGKECLTQGFQHHIFKGMLEENPPWKVGPPGPDWGAFQGLWRPCWVWSGQISPHLTALGRHNRERLPEKGPLRPDGRQLGQTPVETCEGRHKEVVCAGTIDICMYMYTCMHASAGVCAGTWLFVSTSVLPVCTHILERSCLYTLHVRIFTFI